jgi:hypothetical protein
MRSRNVIVAGDAAPLAGGAGVDVSVTVGVAPADDVGAGVAVVPGVAVAEPAGVGVDDAEATLTGGLAVPPAGPGPGFRAE